MEAVKEKGKGLIICLLISLPCWFLGQKFPVIGGPVFAILAGMIVTLFWKDKGDAAPGIQITSKKILPIILSTIATSLIIAFLLSKLLHMPGNISTLVGVGSSICGGSAIAATAPVIGADDEEIAQSISVIFLFNVIAALIFPTLGGAIGLSNEGFGLFAGTAVNDTSSVTAAAAAWDGMHPGANTLDTATIVKLTRTLAIIPITLALAFWRANKTKREGQAEDSGFSLKSVFPMFILYFVLASVITTVCSVAGVPGSTFAPFKTLSKFFIVMAMAAIGLNTDLVKLVKSGGKPIFMGLCCWIGIACVSLGMQHVLGIW